MKEYKIVKQKGKVFGNPDQELAKEGWRVISVCCMSHSTLVKAYLERDKFR